MDLLSSNKFYYPLVILTLYSKSLVYKVLMAEGVRC